MGVDFTHCDARWAYSGFNRFRGRLAAACGAKWDGVMVWFSHEKKPTDAENEAEWNKVIDHPIYPLLNHSDCDGHLTPDECVSVAKGIDMIVKNWPPDDYDRIKAEQLRDGCLAAAAAKENLEFH